MTNSAGKVALAVLSFILLIGILVGGYLGGWWLKEDTANRNTGITNESLARQQARLDEVLDLSRDITRIDVQLTTATPEQAPAIQAQRIALVANFCDAYAGLTGRLTVPQSTITLNALECT